MPTFAGKFRYQNADGSVLQAGPCRVALEAEALTLTPDSGTPLSLDLGDIDVFLPGDYELTLTLYTSKRILLSQFGKAFQNLAHDLLEAYRKRLLQCLLLEDLEEITRFDATVKLDSPARTFSSPAELRLCKSNLAVLPTQATGFQWRLAEIDAVTKDESTWAITLESGGERLAVTKLAKRTEEFRERLATAIQEVNARGAGTVHALFPFLNPDQCQEAASLMKEGRAIPIASLRRIHPKIDQALAANVVDSKQRPYFDALMAHVPGGSYFAGFKLIRKEDVPEGNGQHDESGTGISVNGSEESGMEEQEQPVLHWFFLPLAAQPGAKQPGNLVAWEATSLSGRATYFFRIVPPEQASQLRDPSQGAALVDAAMRELNRAIVLLNFRREPIYLPDDSLMLQPRFRRYAIACRKLPELARLRSSFLGRAIHTSPEAWQKQFASFLEKA